jgi:hypothetical protein
VWSAHYTDTPPHTHLRVFPLSAQRDCLCDSDPLGVCHSASIRGGTPEEGALSRIFGLRHMTRVSESQGRRSHDRF